MNRDMLKEIMSNMDVVRELDEYGKNKLAVLMEGLLIEIVGKERHEYLLENPKDKGNGIYRRTININTGLVNWNLKFQEQEAQTFVQISYLLNIKDTTKVLKI